MKSETKPQAKMKTQTEKRTHMKTQQTKHDMTGTNLKQRLRYHVTGAIERGESTPIVEQTAQAHSPLPWSYSGINGDNDIMSGRSGIHGKFAVAEVVCDGAIIRQREADGNKEFIVRACNNAQRLADACEQYIEAVKDADRAIREALAQWEASK